MESKVDEIKGSVQTKQTQKGKSYLYTVIYIPHLGKYKWEATGLEAKGNIRKAEAILDKRIHQYKIEQEEIENTGQNKKLAKVTQLSSWIGLLILLIKQEQL